MNKTYKYLAMAALALGVVACQQDDEFASLHSDVVRIASANIAAEVDTRVNTLENGNAFEFNDQILLVNENRTNKNKGFYTYKGSAWSTSDMVLYASGTNTFKAYYPAQESFVLPVDQSTTEGIKSADRMIASATATKGNAVSLSFARQMAKVTVNVTMNTEYSSTTKISSLTINSYDGKQVTPYGSDKSYTAILTPGTYTSGATFIEVTVGDKTMTVPVNSTLTGGLQAGKHYTFSLTVGKEAVISNDVTVKSWTTTAITDGEAEEIVIPYLTFAAINEQYVTVNINGTYDLGDNFEYSLNNGAWTTLTANTAIKFGGTNGNLRLRGKSNNGTATDGKNYAYFDFTYDNHTVRCTGDIRTLVDYSNYNTVNTENARFCSLFENCDCLKSTPDLPATKLASYCYFNMFHNCSKLTTTPALPAMTMKESCYNSMFWACDALTTALELPATTLAKSCYANMFGNCNALTNVQNILPATTLQEACYKRMYYGCRMTSAPTLPASTLVKDCYRDMFAYCEKLNNVVMLATTIPSNEDCLTSWLVSSTDDDGDIKRKPGTITLKTGVTLPTGESGIPEGWTVIRQ
ncbi:MAG: fimbrillin family protein [Bacteroidaceae bacterium]|nr:fimbrillin family protein [Bacteroidaceae bacterium]